ncbi:response regulator transcription factor [Fontimonas sp. SYSU GA230001]|uniref:response regulator transcription factor n=1 Tax=Fontimonas sp. SYSU GA230001 TaxID=3142450 RepID=UPI0032B3ECAA
MNILLVDDHELFREGLQLLLADLDDDLNFSQASNCAAALERIGEQSFDVIVLDFHLPGLQRFDALRAVRAHAEEAAIVVLSAEEDPTLIRQVIDEGAAGFIPKASSHAVMMAALRLILAGGTYLPPHALASEAPPPASAEIPQAGPVARLTERQLSTLRLAMLGKSNKVIAREMDLSEATVKAHLAECFKRLGVHNRTEAVFAVARAGLKI